MANEPFTNDDMADVAEIFQAAYTQALARFHDPEERQRVIYFVADVNCRWRWVSMIGSQGLKQITDLVFPEEMHHPQTVGHFIDALVMQFFGRWAEGPQKYTALCESLAQGLSSDRESKLRLMPSKLTEPLPDVEAATELLAANKWLTMLVLTGLFVTFTPEDAVKAAKSKEKAAPSNLPSGS